jgi:hypothetical protein
VRVEAGALQKFPWGWWGGQRERINGVFFWWVERERIIGFPDRVFK